MIRVGRDLWLLMGIGLCVALTSACSRGASNKAKSGAIEAWWAGEMTVPATLTT